MTLKVPDIVKIMRYLWNGTDSNAHAVITY